MAVAADDQLFAVTTRSRLRGPWFFPAMMIASARIRRQLARTGDVVRWASVVAGPTEFWTITVWRSRHDMQEFMRSGAHDDIMWLFSRWLESFWLMRWRPGPEERGSWKGLSMARPDPAYESDSPGPTSNAVLQQALEHLPLLAAATGADGAACYESSAYARNRREEVGGAGGVVVHVTTSLAQTPAALLMLRRLRRQAREHHDVLRIAVGVGRPGELYLLGVWRERAGAQRLLRSSVLEEAARRWPDGLWANEWLPENEFGHWDGMRLRRARSRYTIQVPKAALDLAEPS